MSFPFYKAERGTRPAGPLELPVSLRAGQDAPDGYMPDPGLADAANVALLLGQPLLLTGEPGSGKTQLAYHLAWQLGYPPPLVFNAKSTSSARDLFYTYDALGRFQAAPQANGAGKPEDPKAATLPYLKFQALGLAILRANPRDAVKDWLPAGFEHEGPGRSVVLIDEVDKAPRDFPNDILNEIEQMSFRVPELANAAFSAPETMRPILVITSNSEKNLPDAFLRRCAYYHIPFPDRERLIRIIESRTGITPKNEGRRLKDTLDLFELLRGPKAALKKKPATAELLGFLIYLNKALPGDEPLRNHESHLKAGLSILVKLESDRPAAQQVLDNCLAGRSS
jgi:MoxR-like ATPase